MSGYVAGLVWQSNLPRRLKPVAAALADCANDDGTSIEPSVAYVAWLVGGGEDEEGPQAAVRGERAVQNAMAELRGMGVLVEVSSARGGRGTAGRPARYRMDLEKLPKRTPWSVTRDRLAVARAIDRARRRGYEMGAENDSDTTEKGAEVAPIGTCEMQDSAPIYDEKGADLGTEMGADRDEKRVQLSEKRVQKIEKRVQQDAPDPPVRSANEIRQTDPSERSNVTHIGFEDEDAPWEARLNELASRMAREFGAEAAFVTKRLAAEGFSPPVANIEHIEHQVRERFADTRLMARS